MTEGAKLPTILVVDDAPESLQVLAEVLGSDYRVRVAISGEAALKLVEHATPDIVLLDVMMAGMDGYEVCRQLKLREEMRHVPVIFVTALGEVEDEAAGFAVGAVDYITKPISPALVKARVATHLTLYRQRREVEDACRRAQEGARARSEFLAMMSHEIRTPLNGILGMVRVLMEMPLGPEESEIVQTIHYSGEALRAIVDDVLDFSKMDAGKLSLEAIPFNLHQTLEGVVSLMASRAHEKSLRLNLDIGPDVPATVNGDPLRLRQILLNLAANAIKFTPQGRVDIKVAAEQAEGRSRIRFTVTDTGIGIEPQLLDGLFADFSQADNSIARRFGGSGLGLAICRKLTEMMGGEIGVSSQVGAGSSFRVEIPFDLVAPTSGKSGLDQPEPDLRPLAILLAEDNPVNQKVATALLTRRGHRVTVVGDGEAAVAEAEKGGFDLVLMDIHMPQLDGILATQRIRAFPGLVGRVPIIALTADALGDEQSRVLAAGMNGLLRKPISVPSLLAMMDQVMMRT